MKTIAGVIKYVSTAICMILSLSGCEKDSSSYSIEIFQEAIPGSKHHDPNGTWWGYNQSKIVRKGSNVLWKNTFYQDIINNGTKTSNTTTGSGSNGSWMRLVEAGGDIYYLCSAWDKLYIRKGANGKYIKLDVPSVNGMYIYTSASRGGTSRNEPYLDIQMLCGNSSSYPNAKNYYVRILKSDLEKLD